MRGKPHCLIFLLLSTIAFFARPAYSQTRQIVPPMAPQVVRLNLAALDARGMAVSDLGIDEVQISDAGKPQQIVYFRRDDNGPSPGAKMERRDSASGSGGNPPAILVLFYLLN